MHKKILVFLLLPLFVYAQDTTKDHFDIAKSVISKDDNEKKQFLLPDIEPLVLPPEEILNREILTFTPKTIKTYSPVIQKATFGLDVSDIGQNLWCFFKNSNNYFYQFNILPIGVFFKHGIFVGLDGGYSWIHDKHSGPFINLSIGWEYFNIGFCSVAIGIAKTNNKYPLWWMITPLSKIFKLLQITESWTFNMRVEILFKRLIFDSESNTIPFFGDKNALNIKNTHFDFRIYLETQYTNIDDKIQF